ncbi:PREDICTED: RNA polymerase II-associated protein 1 [Dinoponera quadriceps]|uniref:RNA polymerase II-associated protein 1 n=1 Tax=Dinoponera quadriceps TaxID=609295 RepID=A0A6P3XU43_DINQU|nr:PREDICTED: RNA polymerase II-associated protein 1 [Dinoponera quadriceps]XP_014481419.1 PREDICTED: RNA polymerase II-associated protein 1 [Dinoponera quadriceps]
MASEPLWKRPKTNDDEDELLRQQEEFLKAKEQPFAKIINLKNSSKNIENNIRASCNAMQEGKRRSHFSNLRRCRLKQEIVSTSQSSGGIIHPVVEQKMEEQKLADAVQNIPIELSNIILGNIVEKTYQIKKYKFDNSRVSLASEMGFPQVYGVDVKKTNGNQSLFWHKTSMKAPVRYNSVNNQGNERNNKEQISIVNDDQMAIEVHNENLEKLAEMSKAEILKEKKNLEKTLDPSIIHFLRNKNKKSGKRSLNQDGTMQCDLSTNDARMNANEPKDKNIKLSSDDDDTKMDCESGLVDIPKSSKNILEEGKQKGWLHMDSPEPEKLKWMDDLSVRKNDESAPEEYYNARFDFNGLLLPYKDESLTVDKGLHHHGEEPERPGYSLQELLQLSRSSTQQQRCTALTTLSNIMEKTRRGWYDKALHPAPLSALSQKNILLLLRFSLDDTSVAVVTAALQTLRAFLCSEADEVCLDRLYGLDDYAEPTLTPQLEDRNTSSLKDHELAQLDAVAALLRSDFLLRIRYILSEMHPPSIGVTSALEILIRIARHSHIAALNISSTPQLLNTIIHSFMPLSTDRLAMQDVISNAYGIPAVKAVKLCRVLVTYGKKPVAQKLNNFKVIQIILTYISSETGKKDDINLSIESLRLWRLLLHYEVGLDSVAGSQLTLMSQLQLLLSNHDIQSASELACEYAAALIAVASRERTLKPSISILLAKWSTQLSVVSNMTWGVMKLIAETLSAVGETSAFRTMWIFNPNLFSTFRSNSNLLCKHKPATDREPSSLPSLGVLTEDGELLPIVSLNSCVPFLTTVLNKFRDDSRLTEIRAMFEQPSLRKYVQDLETAEWSFERSWYSRSELCLLTAMVRAASLLNDTFDDATSQIVRRITIKLVSALPADATRHVKELLRVALSNERVNLGIVTNELAKLDLTSAAAIPVNLCSDVASLYESYVSPNGDWSQAAMPKDWLFLPLVNTYTKCRNNIGLEDTKHVVTVLSLALVLPDLMEGLSPTLKFSRLILVYLCDTVYLNKNVSLLLTSVLSDLLKRYHARLDFRTELPGLSSFVDLFTAICEHFCSSSYGDDGFATILLVPVAQRHDAHYRKLLWSEHAGVLRYLRLPPEKLMVPLKEYLYPEEEDASLIESYITALVRGVVRETWCPIPYAIALHHSAMYLKRPNKLAMRMRTQVEKLRDKDIAGKLLQYEPPRL